jgi:hypothetical protein
MELNISGVCCARVIAERRARDRSVDARPAVPVKDVIHFRPEIETNALSDREHLTESNIFIFIAAVPYIR